MKKFFTAAIIIILSLLPLGIMAVLGTAKPTAMYQQWAMERLTETKPAVVRIPAENIETPGKQTASATEHTCNIVVALSLASMALLTLAILSYKKAPEHHIRWSALITAVLFFEAFMQHVELRLGGLLNLLAHSTIMAGVHYVEGRFSEFALVHPMMSLFGQKIAAFGIVCLQLLMRVLTWLGTARTFLFSVVLGIVLCSSDSAAQTHHTVTAQRLKATGYELYIPTNDNGVKPGKYELDGTLTGIASVKSDGVICFEVQTYLPAEKGDSNSLSSAAFSPKLEFRNVGRHFGDKSAHISLPFRGWTYGLATIPFRYRPSVSNAAGDVIPAIVCGSPSIVATAGYTIGFTRFAATGANHYSLTSGLILGSSATELKKETVRQPEGWQGTQTAVSISYGVSVTLARNNLGVVLSIGADNVIGNNSGAWIYDNKPWIGIGINTAFTR